MDFEKIIIHKHAQERMQERGATEEEVIQTLKEGEKFPAKFGRIGFRRNFSFEGVWRGKIYKTKQIFSRRGNNMKLSYDSKYNIAYIKFKDKTEQVETIHLSDEVNIDLTPDGKIYGIELLNANEQLQILKDMKFIFTDQSSGLTIELPINFKSKANL
jgi:uncharacterized protein YuzE